MPKASHVENTPTPNRRLKPPVALDRALRRCCHYDIQTVYGLVNAFGGFEAVASDYTGGPAEDIERWAIGGSIPTGWSLRMFARACAMGLTVNPSVFGFWDDDEAGQALAQLMHDARPQREGGDNE